MTEPPAATVDVRSRRVVLAVDDDPAIRTWLTRSLEGAGYGVITAHDQQSAETVLLDSHVDAVIMELRLGEQSGLELLDFVRTHDNVASLPILMLTGVARMTLAEQQSIRQHGAHIFYKPASGSDMAATVNQLFATSR